MSRTSFIRSRVFASMMPFSGSGGVTLGCEAFQKRWQDEPQLDAEDWFRRALALDEGDTDVAGGKVPLGALVPALRDARWYVRNNAVARLEEEFGVSFGRAARYATESDVEMLAERWTGSLTLPAGARSRE